MPEAKLSPGLAYFGRTGQAEYENENKEIPYHQWHRRPQILLKKIGAKGYCGSIFHSLKIVLFNAWQTVKLKLELYMIYITMCGF